MSPKEMQSASYLKIFASFYKPHLGLFTMDMICALCIALVDLSFPLISRFAMSELLPNGLIESFFFLMLFLIATYFLKGFFTYIVTYWGHLMGVRIEADIRTALFRHMQQLSFSFYDKNRVGMLMSRVTADLFEITELSHHGPEDIFISLVTLLGAFIMMFRIRWELALIVFTILPLFLLFTVWQRTRMSRASRQVKQTIAGINGEIESSLSGMRTAKAFANETQESRKFEAANSDFRGAKQGFYSSMATYHSGLELAMGMMPVLVIAAGGIFFMSGEMDYIDLMTFTLYVSTFTTPIRKLSAFVEMYTQGMAGFKRFVDLMRMEPDIQDSPNAKEMDTVIGEISLQNVSFTYEEQGEWVLDDVSLTVKAGETVAVVGPSGGGKSTLCQLIPRFYDVTQGVISIDDVDIRHFTQHSLRSHIGIVQQDVFLFAGTIYDNIAYGRPDATREEIIEAAKKAEIYKDIMDMPQGFDTYVGERGVMLSGGQKQRVSIARIFLKNPSILILDEATSALDSVTEHRIQGAFDALAQGRTTLIIAHRLSTIRSAHRILVVDHNKIVEEGDHDTLLALDGAYAELYHTQQLVQAASM